MVQQVKARAVKLVTWVHSLKPTEREECAEFQHVFSDLYICAVARA